MNNDERLERLLRAARTAPVDDHVPYAFEQRILERLDAAPAPDVWSDWAVGLWRAAAPCLAVMLVVSVWHWTTPADAADETLTVSLENTVLAPADSVEELW